MASKTAIRAIVGKTVDIDASGDRGMWVLSGVMCANSDFRSHLMKLLEDHSMECWESIVTLHGQSFIYVK